MSAADVIVPVVHLTVCELGHKNLPLDHDCVLPQAAEALLRKAFSSPGSRPVDIFGVAAALAKGGSLTPAPPTAGQVVLRLLPKMLSFINCSNFTVQSFMRLTATSCCITLDQIGDLGAVTTPAIPHVSLPNKGENAGWF